MIAEVAFGFLVFMGLLPVVAGSEGEKESSMDAIKQKKRSLNGHKLQLGNHTRDCRSKIGHYKAVKSTEAREMVDRAFLKVMD